jgi:uncharacterized damage-inducible protein DinB
MTTALLLERFKRMRRGTRTLVAAIPDAQFDWRPGEGAFSCGDLVRHLMQSEIFWRKLLVAGSRGEPFDPFKIAGTGEERLRTRRPEMLASAHDDKWGTSAADCLARWADIQAKTERELAAIPDHALDVEMEHPLLAIRAPVWDMFMIFIEHEVHHRGQLSAYFKALGIDQPTFIVG